MASLGAGLADIMHQSLPEQREVTNPSRLLESPPSGGNACDSMTYNTLARSKTYEEELNDWFKSGDRFQRHEDFYRSIVNSARKQAHKTRPLDPITPTGPRLSRAVLSSSRFGAIGTPPRPHPVQGDSNPSLPFNGDTTRVLIPVLENVASYVQGPADQRRDYWCRWSEAPDWCVDRSPGGNDSFNDENWGRPPQRLGRDPRYSPYPGEGRHGSIGGPVRRWSGGNVGGLDRRFMFVGGRY